MGIVKIRSTDDYFSKDPFLDFTPIKKIIGRDRLRNLLRYLHFVDGEGPAKGQPGYDPLFKIRPIIDNLQKSFVNNWTTSSSVTVDEGMIPTRSPKSRMRVYMPNKPIKWGIKVWKMCDSSKYVKYFEIYTGALGNNGIREVDLGPNVIRKMVSHLESNRTYLVFADNFFSSLEIAKELLQKGNHFTGTIKQNRKGLPSGEWKQLEKNDFDYFYKDNILALTWLDSAQVGQRK